MTISWTLSALEDLVSVHDYIAFDNRAAADATVARLVEGIQLLTQNPEMGRRGRVPGTRELVAAPFIAVYTIRKETIEIVAIFHSARKWPEAF